MPIVSARIRNDESRFAMTRLFFWDILNGVIVCQVHETRVPDSGMCDRDEVTR